MTIFQKLNGIHCIVISSSLLEIKYVAYRYISKHCTVQEICHKTFVYSYSGIQLIDHTLSLRCPLASELLKSLAQQERLLVRDHWMRSFLIPRNRQVFCSGNYKGNLNIIILVQDLNKFMSKRVYLVGHELTLADIMLYYALHPVMLELTVHGKEQLINLSRWFNQVLFQLNINSGSACSRAPWVRKFGYQCIQEILVPTKSSICISAPSCKLG